MGYEKVDLKRTVIQNNNQLNGLNADGSKPEVGLMDSTLEKGAFAAGCAIPVWQHKAKIGQAWANRSWQNVGNAYAQGWKNSMTTFRNPMNYYDLEFLNSKTAKIESILNKNTPKMPKKAKFDGATQELFKKLCEAKNPEEFKKLIGKKGSDTYKQFQKLVKHLPSQEAAKLKNIAKYNELYGGLLQEFKAAQTQAQAGKLGKGRIDVLHKNFAQARQAESQFIQANKAAKAAKSSSKAVKTGAKMAKSSAKISNGVKNAMAASKTLRTFNRGVGKAGGYLCAGLSTVTAGLDIYSAVAASPDGEGLKNGLKQAGKSAVRLGCELGAMAAGQWIGAAVGQALIPIPGVGAAIGGFVGSFIGMYVGSKVADKIPYTQKTVAEEIMEEQADSQNKQICQAIEDDDIETVNGYTAQFKEQAVDEQGNALADAEGNPLVTYKKVYDDEQQQKEFEQRLASLDNYVETEAVKRQKAAQLKQEAAAAEQQRLYAQQQAPSYGSTPSLGYGATASTGYSFGSATNSNFYDFSFLGIQPTAQTTPSFSGASWQNPAWQHSLGQRFDSQNFYAFDMNNYSPMMPMNYNMYDFKNKAA